MAWRIVKQPNGKYARFSEVVDDFTHMDMTREEAVAYCSWRMPPSDAENKVANADKELDRWDDELETVLAIHGKEAYDQAVAIGDPIYKKGLN